MSETVTSFFDRNFENCITEQMLEYGYDFPTDKLENYVIDVIATPYRQFVEYVHDHICLEHLQSASQIPQTSSYALSTYGVCKMLNAIEDPGVSVLDFGRFLYPKGSRNVYFKDIEACPDERVKDFAHEHGIQADRAKVSFICLDGRVRTKGAVNKIAENQLKGASFHSLAYETGGMWFLTCLGRIYSTLDEEMQHALSARTLLREPFFWKVVAKAVDEDVDFMPYIESVCSGSTIERRRTSSQHYFDLCTEIAKIENYPLHRIFGTKRE